VQPVNRVAVTLTAALPLKALLHISPTGLQQAYANTMVVKLAGDSDPSGPGPNYAEVGKDLFIACHHFTDHG
jgi:hypothetical protein